MGLLLGGRLGHGMIRVLFGLTGHMPDVCSLVVNDSHWREQMTDRKCGECNGTGKLTVLGGDWGKRPDTEVVCWACHGTGKAR